MFQRTLQIAVYGVLTLGVVGCQAPRKEKPAVPRAPPEARMLGSLKFQYPSYRTLEELKQAMVVPYESNAQLYIFEKDEIKVAVCVQPWGGIGWDALVVYQFSAYREQWFPCAVWNPYAMKVRVTFTKATGMIEVCSGGGMLIFSANIAALKARQNPFDW